jgi:hypothetical protein
MLCGVDCYYFEHVDNLNYISKLYMNKKNYNYAVLLNNQLLFIMKVYSCNIINTNFIKLLSSLNLF